MRYPFGGAKKRAYRLQVVLLSMCAGVRSALEVFIAILVRTLRRFPVRSRNSFSQTLQMLNRT